jgi:hypothetical protein
MDDLDADELPVADEARTFDDPSPAHLRVLQRIKEKVQSSGKNIGLVFRQLDGNGKCFISFLCCDIRFGIGMVCSP